MRARVDILTWHYTSVNLRKTRQTLKINTYLNQNYLNNCFLTHSRYQFWIESTTKNQNSISAKFKKTVRKKTVKMMTISESQYSSNKMSSIHTFNDRVIHRDSYDDVKSSSSVNSALVTKRGFKPSDMFDPQKKEFLTNLSYKLFPVSWVSYCIPS